MVKLTKGTKQERMIKMEIIDFAYCFTCYHFIDLNQFAIDEGVKRRYCHTDKFIDINPNRQTLWPKT